MSRPDEIVDWAEGTGAQTSEPANERAGGFPFRYRPPAEQINWMWRTVGRWIRWLDTKANGHVHDGGSTDLSVPKVSFTDHLNYGSNGKMSVDVDTAVTHKIKHAHTSTGEAEFETDRVIAEKMDVSELFQIGASSTTLKNKNPALKAWLQVDGNVQTMNGGMVMSKTLNTDAGALAPLRVEDQGNNLTYIESLSTPRAMGLISSAGNIAKGYKIASATQDSVGVYHVKVTGVTGANAIITATASQWVLPTTLTTTVGSNDTIVVHLFDDSGAPSDCAFSIVVYW